MDYGYVAGFFDGEGSVKNAKRTYGLVFYNTHRETLDAIRAFLGCGTIYQQAWNDGRVCWRLDISRRDDLVVVIPELLNHSIIKRERLERLFERALASRGNPNCGRLASLGKEEIVRMYWEEGLTQAEIARRTGVTPMSVHGYMVRHGIPKRRAA